MIDTPRQLDAYSIHPKTHLGSVTLRVADLQRSIDFYTSIIGLQVVGQAENDGASLGTGGQPILHLREVLGAARTPKHVTGLYHAAILLPNRKALASTVYHLHQSGIQFGYADHLVSEAFYLSDPDGSGLELYRDRPREEWGWENGSVKMDNAPIDFDSLFAELNGDASWSGLPEGTNLGHMHLQIGDTAKAEAFYHGILGFDVVARWTGALFVSAGGYHHHLGLNTWNSRNAPPAPSTAAGLESFSILLPDQSALDELVERLKVAQIEIDTRDEISIRDPWQNRLVLKVG
jgi:catechol 2,3-dioxygenase